MSAGETEGALILGTTLQQRPLVIRQNDGTEKKWVMWELNGVLLGQWRTYTSDMVKIGGKGVPVGMKPMDLLYAKLISLSLRDAAGNGPEMAEVQSWPATTQRAVYKACRDLSGLGEEEEEEGDAAKKP